MVRFDSEIARDARIRLTRGGRQNPGKLIPSEKKRDA